MMTDLSDEEYTGLRAKEVLKWLCEETIRTGDDYNAVKNSALKERFKTFSEPLLKGVLDLLLATDKVVNGPGSSRLPSYVVVRSVSQTYRAEKAAKEAEKNALLKAARERAHRMRKQAEEATAAIKKVKPLGESRGSSASAEAGAANTKPTKKRPAPALSLSDKENDSSMSAASGSLGKKTQKTSHSSSSSSFSSSAPYAAAQTPTVPDFSECFASKPKTDVPVELINTVSSLLQKGFADSGGAGEISMEGLRVDALKGAAEMSDALFARAVKHLCDQNVVMEYDGMLYQI